MTVPPPRPGSLRLEFSRSADYGRINDLFTPAQKQAIDPHNYILKRHDHHFRRAVQAGGAAILGDAQGRIAAVTIAYRVNHTDGGPAPLRDPYRHDVTEFGTSMARLPGYGSAQLVVAALTLREWWLRPPRDATIAEIKRDNIASLKTYVDGLHWKPVTDINHARRLYDATDATLTDAKDKGAGKNLTDLSRAPSLWHRADQATIRQAARTILRIAAQGGLLNKKTGDKITVDMTALSRSGLTPARLRAIADGQLDRQSLRRIAPPRGPAP